ncbi:MAG: hypothetical protein FWE18_05805 [Alphaproteobacteria bacterium]|nr:hypothetical protein [Alphaproteobacteria bacterium]
MSAINEYQKQKADILNKSNSLLIALNNKRAAEKSKIKNKTAAGSGGSNEDLQYFMENSLNADSEEILKNQSDALQSLKEKTQAEARYNAVAKRKQDLASIKNIMSSFSKIF